MSYAVSAGDEFSPKFNLSGNEEIIQNVAVILSTLKGTVPLYRDFGLPPEALDRPMPAAEALLRSAVKEAVERWEPRVSVKNITFVRNVEGRLIPTVELEVSDEQ